MAGNRVISAVLTLKDKNFGSGVKKATSSTTDLNRKVKQSKNNLKKFEKSSVDSFKKLAKGAGIAGGAVAGLGTAAFVATDKVTQKLDGINKSSDKLGITTDAFQEMSYWAGQNGIASEQLEKGVGRMTQRMGLAAQGNEKYSSALSNLGVNMNDVKNGTVSTEDAFSTSIQTLSQMTNEQEKSALASELFGTKMARDLMPALQDGALSLDEAKKKAGDLGLVIGGDTVDAATKFQDTWDDAKSSMSAFGTSVIAELMPTFQKILDWALEKMPAVKNAISNGFSAIGGVFDWIREKGRIVFDSISQAVEDNTPSMSQLKDMAMDAGTTMKNAFEKVKPAINWVVDEGIPGAINIISDILGKATDFYNYIKNNWSLIGPVVAGITATVAAFKVGIMAVAKAKAIWKGVTTGVQIATALLNGTLAISPLGWVALAIGAVVAAGVLLWKNWDTVIGWAKSLWSTVKTNFGEMKESVVTWFGDMKDSAVEKFDDIIQSAKDLPGKIGKGIADFASDAWQGMKDLADGMISKFKEVLGINSPSKVFYDMAHWIVKGLTNGLSVENLKDLGMSVFKDFAGGVFSTFGKIKGFLTGSGAGGNVKSWIAQAMDITGVSKNWASSLETIAMKESGGRTGPGTINKWDSNWDRGTPSMGLMQTIRPTFEAYKGEGMDDIMNPVHNAVASINYIKSRYGSVFNTPGIKSMNNGGAYRGYWRGGDVPYGQRILVGEKGPELMDVPGGTKVHSNEDSRRMSGATFGDIIINGVNLSVEEITNELLQKLMLRLNNM